MQDERQSAEIKDIARDRPFDYAAVVEKYSKAQLNKAHEIVSDMLECAKAAMAEEKNFAKEVSAIESTQEILEKCINLDA